MTPISQQECRGNLEFAESIFQIYADSERVIFWLVISDKSHIWNFFAQQMFWETTKILAFFGTLSKGSEEAPFYFVFFPHCTSPRFRVSYSMYLNIGCNYIVVLSVLDRRYIGDIMNKEFLQNLREQIKAGTVTEQEPMNKHTSFAIGGPADVFVQPATREEIRSAVYCAKEAGIPFFVMGNGSNLLVSDEGFRGMIIQIGKNFQEISVKDTVIEVQAGALLSRTARAAWNAGLTGFEFAAGIPGSVGGAVAMNAGAYGGEVKDVLLDAEVLTQAGEFLTLTGEELDLSYRHSCIFEKNYVVLSARFSFEKGESDKIKARMDELAKARREKQPLEFPSAGSTFKRPEGYFAGKLIQDAGLKGYTVGGAQVSEKHSGFVVNRGGATAEEVAFLIKQVQKKVMKQFNVMMQPEVRFVGFADTEVKE